MKDKLELCLCMNCKEALSRTDNVVLSREQPKYRDKCDICRVKFGMYYIITEREKESKH